MVQSKLRLISWLARSFVSARTLWGVVGLVLTTATSADTLHVPDDLVTIQACIDAASDGDECVVAPGTYNELINFNGKAITLRSSEGPDVTIIDAGPVENPGTGKSVVRCENGEGPDTVLDGFTITGGIGSICFNTLICGGGMRNESASPTVIDCAFIGNRALTYGGGMYNESSSPTVTDCTFIENISNNGGGGMYNAHDSIPTVTNTTFHLNSGGFRGGGMANRFDSHAIVTDCTFTENSADFFGGGMFNTTGSNPTVTNCVFNKNTVIVNGGGGMYNADSALAVTNCTFSGNSSSNYGGGMYNQHSSPMVINCTFFGNTAGSQGGGAIANDLNSDPRIFNCILWGNTPNQMVNGDVLLDTPWLSSSCLQGGLPAGTVDVFSNIFEDPMFVDANGFDDIPGTPDDDLRLLPESPCIDGGKNSIIPADVADLDGDGDTVEAIPHDLDGHARVLCGDVDMGAYESGIGDYDCNAVVDLSDFGGWESCMTGPGSGPLADGCEAFDFDGDNDVDFADWYFLQIVITGSP